MKSKKQLNNSDPFLPFYDLFMTPFYLLPRALSFKHTHQLWLGWSGNREPPEEQDAIYGLLALVAEQSIGNRPGRTEPRAIKQRPKPYPLLTKPRHEARDEVKKMGPRKSLSKCHSTLTPFTLLAFYLSG